MSGNCSHGDIRLAFFAEDSNDLSGVGTVEVCVNNVWSSVCDSSFGARDARVVCAQLNYEDQSEMCSEYVTCILSIIQQ